MEPPRSLLDQAGLTLTGRRLPTRNSASWVARHRAGLVILRRLDPRLSPPASSEIARDLAWLHGYLARLARTGFPAPHPVPAWDGTSWMLVDGAWWEAVSYLPGHAVGWNDAPPLPEVGALLARFHAASAAAPASTQRPISYPVDALDGSRLGPSWRRRLDQLAADLDRLPVLDVKCVVHGDFTTHNVLANGRPPHPCGVIDFALAHVDNPWADIGYALWRSGRPHQDAIDWDPDRIIRFVAGYRRISDLPPDAATAIPIYMTARGLQQAVRARTLSMPIPGHLHARLEWLSTHRTILTEHILRTLDR